MQQRSSDTLDARGYPTSLLKLQIQFDDIQIHVLFFLLTCSCYNSDPFHLRGKKYQIYPAVF